MEVVPVVTNFEGFEETPEAATKEAVQLMNQLDLGTSTEDDCISIRAYAQ
jgi:hypothetical protein